MLSTQAVQVSSIKTHVQIVLDLQASNYAKGRELFIVTLGKYSLTRHVDGTGASSSDNTWARDYFTVLSWIYGFISMEILNIVMQPGSSAQTVWDVVENLFRDNMKA